MYNLWVKINVYLKNDIKAYLLVENVEYKTQDFTIRAFINEKEVGLLNILNKADYIVSYMVQVNRDYRRLSLATKMYDLATEITNKRLIPNEYFNLESPSSEDAIAFWRKRGLVLSNGDRFFD